MSCGTCKNNGSAGDAAEFAAQPVDHLIGADLADAERFELAEHARGVGGTTSGKRHDGIDCWICDRTISSKARIFAVIAVKELS